MAAPGVASWPGYRWLAVDGNDRGGVITGTGRAPEVVADYDDSVAGPGGPVRSTSSGLSLPGAVVLVLVSGAAGAAADLLLGDGLGLVFAACFVLGSVLAAVAVRVGDVRATAVMPPLLYVVLCAGGAAVTTRHGAGSWPLRLVLETSTSMLAAAPALFAASALAAVTWVVRSRRARRF